MKKHILTSILALVSASCFAIDPTSAVAPITSVIIPRERQATPTENLSANKGFFYVRMNVAEPQAHVPELKQTSFLPGLGIGYRRGEASAIDISLSVSHIKDEKNEATYWAFPKMSYLRYFSPKKGSSFYAGAGLNWGGVTLKNENQVTIDEIVNEEEGQLQFQTETSRTAFFGIIPTACIGYEANRKEGSWRSFVQLEVSQPILAVAKKGAFPGPVAEFTVGLGY